MILTDKQQKGLDLAVARYNEHKAYTCIAGYAGSGKSTLIKFIVKALNIPNEQVAYVAYTGKAAAVLQAKGNPNATTVHKLLYNARPRANGTFYFQPVPVGEIHYKLIVVDEVSMVPKEMWERLLRHRIYILATGDPM